MRKITLAALAASGAVVALPSAAQAQFAPALGIAPGACFIAGQEVPVPFSGFVPTTAIAASIPAENGNAIGSEVTDAAGAGSIGISLSNVREASERAFTPTTLTVGPLSSSGAAAPPVSVPVTILNAPVATTGGTRTGSPRRSVTWSFAAFAEPGQPIYGHVRFRGRTVRNFRFGTAGPCGTLTRKAPALPISGRIIRSGSYTIQLDSSRTYRRDADAPAYRYRVFRTFRFR